MESNTRSPIFANFGELLEGIVTVRAFSAEKRFLEFHTSKVDLTTKVRLVFPDVGHLLTSWIDVVLILDDKPLAASAVRFARCCGSLDDNLIRAVWLRQGRPCWCLYHLGHGIHEQRVLGLPVLDCPRA